MKQIRKIVLFLVCSSIFVGCEEDTLAELTVSDIYFTETYSNEVLDLPNGSYVPDNPDFDINNPETWTGNMATYVNHNYLYSVTYTIKNSGGSIAYDTEIDLHYSYDNGEEIVETLSLGDIKPNKSISKTTGIGCTNKQLIECSCEVFWFD